MAAHRYWRLFISRTGGGSSTSVGELILATTPSGAQAATGGTASASSTNGVNEASRAFDGTTSAANYWQSASGTFSTANGAGQEYLQYDMGVGGGIDVVEVRLYFNGSTSGSLTYPSNFALLYSDDGIKWTLQRAWSELSFTNGETKTLDATPLPSNQIFNRVVVRRDYRYNAAANAGTPPSVSRVLPHRLIGFGVRHCTAPAVLTPWSGNYYIAGSTTVLGEPYARRVDLVDQRSGLLVRTFYTKADGAFLFENIGPGPWTLVGVDNTAEQNSVVFAHVPPALMT
jgi:hypothetical protein